jgi:hypothetical protein
LVKQFNLINPREIQKIEFYFSKKTRKKVELCSSVKKHHQI